ncbi:unnamed protein product, partial [Callosobruchus maculatus]
SFWVCNQKAQIIVAGVKLERYKRKSYRAQQKNEPSTSQNRKQQQYKCWGHL